MVIVFQIDLVGGETGKNRHLTRETTKTQLSQLEQELRGYGFTNEEIKFIISSPEFVRDILVAYLNLKKRGVDKKTLPKQVLDQLNLPANPPAFIPMGYVNIANPLVLYSQLVNRFVDKFQKMESEGKNLASLQNLIEQRFSFKLDGERVWIYLSKGEEGKAMEQEKWKFRIPPGLRKSNPDLARFFDLSNKFNIDARSWIENPEEAAKQFNDEVRKRLFKKTEKKPDLVLHFAEMFKDIKSDKFQPKNYERELTFIRVFSEFDNAGKSKHKDYVRTYVLIPLATGEATGTQLLKRAKGDLKTLLGLKDEDINKMGKTELLIMWGIVKGEYNWYSSVLGERLAKLALRYLYRADKRLNKRFLSSLNYPPEEYGKEYEIAVELVKFDVKNRKLSKKDGKLLVVALAKKLTEDASFFVKNKTLTPDEAASMLNGYISTVGKLFGKDVGDLVKGAILRTLIQLGMEEVTGKMLDLSLSRFFNKDGSIKKISEQDAKEILEELNFVLEMPLPVGPNRQNQIFPLFQNSAWNILYL